MNTSDPIKAQLMSADDIQRTLNRMARQITESFSDLSVKRLALVGMQSRGVYLARRLQQRILETEQLPVEFGVLDVAMYRDDARFKTIQVRKTDILFEVDGCHLVLVDDVLYTGRTARAALDALLDLGRPASVRLLTLIDRGLRELPIAPDIVGRYVPTTEGEGIRVRLREYDDHEGVWLVQKTLT